jgi:hypothetical protein
MRERTVSSIYENQQSTVVADIINDAKRQCEDAHDWSVLHTTTNLPIADGDQTYSLTGSQQRDTIKDMRNTTDGYFLTYVPSAYMRSQEMVNDAGESQPRYWTHAGADISGDTQIKLWPIPDQAYTLSVYSVIRQADLAEAGDVLTIPHMPVIHLAHALAARERGDVDGSDSQTLMGLANRSLADAIMKDMGRQPEYNIWAPQ